MIRLRLFLCLLLLLVGLKEVKGDAIQKENTIFKLKDFISLALEENKQLHILKEEIKGRKAMIKVAYAEIFPHIRTREYLSYTKWLAKKKYETKFTLDGETYTQILDEPTYPPYTQFSSLSFSQILWKGDLFTPVKEAKNSLKIIEFQYNLKRQEVLREVIEAYYNLQKALEAKKIYQKEMEIADFLYNVAKIKLEEGLVSELEVKRVKLNLNEAKEKMIRAEGNIRLAEDNLKRLCGLNISKRIKIADDVKFRPIKFQVEEVVSVALANREEIKEGEIEIVNKELNLKRVERQDFPNVSLGGDYIWQSTEKKLKESFDKFAKYQWNISLNFEYPLFDGGNTKSQIKIAKSQLAEKKIELEDIKQRITFEVYEAIMTIKEIEERAKIIFENLDLAEENLQMVKLKYEAGKINLSEVFEVEQTYTRIAMNYLEILCDYELSKVAIYKAMGKLDDYLEE